MARAPIDVLMDRVQFACTRCGANMGQCDCWVKVKLRCPMCKRTMMVSKDKTDPVGTAIVEAPCDRCDDGGLKPETRYYNALGQWFDGEKFVRVRKSP